jgi:hypothetical protein
MITNNDYDKMNNEQRSRWMALLTAIDIIDTNCNNHNIKMKDIDLSPIPIKHYIQEKSKEIEKYLNDEDAKTLNKRLVHQILTKTPICVH